jgi:hypothetical protein
MKLIVITETADENGALLEAIKDDETSFVSTVRCVLSAAFGVSAKS